MSWPYLSKGWWLERSREPEPIPAPTDQEQAVSEALQWLKEHPRREKQNVQPQHQ